MGEFEEAAAGFLAQQQQQAEKQAARERDAEYRRAAHAESLDPVRGKFTELAEQPPAASSPISALPLLVLVFADPLRAGGFAEMVVGYYVDAEVLRWRSLISLARRLPPVQYGAPVDPLPAIRARETATDTEMWVFAPLALVVALKAALQWKPL